MSSMNVFLTWMHCGKSSTTRLLPSLALPRGERSREPVTLAMLLRWQVLLLLQLFRQAPLVLLLLLVLQAPLLLLEPLSVLMPLLLQPASRRPYHALTACCCNCRP